jgi:hypothetical protein
VSDWPPRYPISPEPCQGLGEVVECLVEPAAPVADLAQPVAQGGAHGRLRLEGQRGAEVVGGLLEHPQLGRDGTEVPEHAHLPRPPAGPPGDGQAPGEVGGGGPELARTPTGQAEAVEGDGLAIRPAGLLTVAHGLVVVPDGLWIAGPVPVKVTQAQGRRDLCAQVALGHRGRPAGAGDVLPDGCGDPQPEVAAEGVGELVVLVAVVGAGLAVTEFACSGGRQ